MSTTDELEQAASQAAELAAAASRAAFDEVQRQSTERADREAAWRMAYCAEFDRQALRRSVEDAREALVKALDEDPVGQALIGYVAAMTAERDEVMFARVTASMVGVDPQTLKLGANVVSNEPLTLAGGGVWDGSVETLLFDIVNQAAISRVNAASVARHTDLDEFATAHGEITAPAALPAPVARCGVCGAAVPDGHVYTTDDGRTFHDTAPCRPSLTEAEQQHLDMISKPAQSESDYQLGAA